MWDGLQPVRKDSTHRRNHDLTVKTEVAWICMLDRRSYRRHLPHYQNGNRIYLITFVTLHRQTLRPEAREIVLNEIGRLHERFAFVHAAVVMPDHVHIILQPLWDDTGVTQPLPVILRMLKGRSARRINLLQERQGSIWLDESHDHQLRTSESLTEKIEYVLQNPVRRGIVQKPDDYEWIWRWWIERRRAEARPT